MSKSPKRALMIAKEDREANRARFLEGSKAPRVVYHGTTAPEDFSIFSVGQPQYEEDEHGEGAQRQGSGNDPTAYLGSHFAEEPEVANKFARGLYGEREHATGKHRVYPVHLQIKKPHITTDSKMRNWMMAQNYDHADVNGTLQLYGFDDPEGKRYDKDAKFRKEVNEYSLNNGPRDEYEDYSLAQEMAESYRRHLISKGHDGIKYKNEIEGGTSWVAFDPRQIKSATGNRGTFDPNDPDITKANGGSTDIRRALMIASEPLPERPAPELIRAMDRDARAAWRADQAARKEHPSFAPPGTPEREANFNRWFGKSKLRDKTGNPLRLYHITKGSFQSFIPGGDPNWRKLTKQEQFHSGPATWLSPYPEKQPASHQVGGFEGKFKEGTNVMPVHARIENPLVIDSNKKREAAIANYAEDSFGFPLSLSPKARKKLLADGYDGIIWAGRHAHGDTPFYDTNEIGSDPDKGEEIIALHPEQYLGAQIKSAIGNRGQFSPRDTDVTFARGGSADKDIRRALMIAREIGSPERKQAFEQWGGSPERWYHGTSKDVDFSKFKVGRHGAWFTRNPDTASMYAKENDSQGYKHGPDETGRLTFLRTNTRSRVIPVHLKFGKTHTGQLPDDVMGSSNYKKAQSDWFDRLRAQGYDSWVPEGGDVAVILKDPTNIKSAIGNRGTFDPNDPDITKARGGSADKDIRRALMIARAVGGRADENDDVWWHGSGSGDLRGGESGLHLGTQAAAEDALNARIGFPAEGSWDGTREYGKTKLAGKNTILKRNKYGLSGHNADAPDEDYYPHEHPRGLPMVSRDFAMRPEWKPNIAGYRIKGPMTNTARTPHGDWKANGYMKAALKKGNAKRGHFYRNEGEDSGSISAVVPSGAHVEPIKRATGGKTEETQGEWMSYGTTSAWSKAYREFPFVRNPTPDDIHRLMDMERANTVRVIRDSDTNEAYAFPGSLLHDQAITLTRLGSHDIARKRGWANIERAHIHRDKGKLSATPDKIEHYLRRASGGPIPPFKLKSGAADLIERKGQKKALPAQFAAMPGVKPDDPIAHWHWRPLEDVRNELQLDEIPSHVHKFGEFMDETARRAASQGLTPRDLIKAYAITRASIGRRALPAETLREAFAELPPDVTGRVRPEGAMGHWLHTKMGQRYLDAAEAGRVDEEAIEHARNAMRRFGKDQTEPTALRWAALNLPGKEGRVSELIARAHRGQSSPEEWRGEMRMPGIAESKAGFLASMLGRGDQPTLDARQLILHTGRPTKEAAPILSRKGASEAAVNRLAGRQSELKLKHDPEMSPFYQHLAHHTIWDKAAGEETTHEDLMRALRGAKRGGRQTEKPLSLIASHPVVQGMAAALPAEAELKALLRKAGIVRPYEQPNKENIEKALKIARTYAMPLGAGASTSELDPSAYYNVAQPVAARDVTTKTLATKGYSLKPENPMSWSDFASIGKGGHVLNLSGDRTRFGTLHEINGKKLNWPVKVFAGPDYIREPVKGRAWASGSGVVSGLNSLVRELSKKGPVFGMYSPYGGTGGDFAHHMFDAVMAQVNPDDLTKGAKNKFDVAMRNGHFIMGGTDKIAKIRDRVKQKMGDWPGIDNPKKASEFARTKLTGDERKAILEYLDKKMWTDEGFPHVGITRVAVTDPKLLGVPQNVIGGNVALLKPSEKLPSSQHPSFPAGMAGEYVGTVPFSPRHYALPVSTAHFAKTPSAGKGIHVDPYSLDPMARAGYRTLFERNYVPEPVSQQMVEGAEEGIKKMPLYGLKTGGNVIARALKIARKTNGR